MRGYDFSAERIGTILLSAGAGWFALSHLEHIAAIIAWILLMLGASLKVFAWPRRAS